MPSRPQASTLAGRRSRGAEGPTAREEASNLRTMDSSKMVPVLGSEADPL
ncbi:MAG TPA: hypothetical protein VEH57_00115 [Thermoplasmata archaeon]|nr:hypothetical protein [Thermoplasmata archaeon]